MAEAFAPKIDAGVVSDFTSASKGQIPDKGLGTLFGAIGDAVQGAGALYDKQQQENIRKDVSTVFDDANEPFAQDGVVPDDIQQSRENIKNLSEAYRQGKLSDVAYYGKLNTATKNLKLKYAGREDEVDKIIQSVTGIRPANALRNAVLQELSSIEKEKADAERSWDKYINDDENMGLLALSHPDVYSNPEKYADPAARNQLILQTNTKRAERAASKARVESLKAMDIESDFVKKNLEKEWRQSGVVLVDTAIDGLNNILGDAVPKGVDVMDYLQKVTNGEIPLDPEELLGLQVNVNTIKNKLKLQIIDSARDTSESGISTFGVIGGDRVNKIAGELLEPLDTIMSMINDKDVTAATIAAATVKLKQDKALAKFFNEPGVAAYLGLTPELKELYFSNGKNAQAIQMALDAISVTSVMNGDKKVSEVLSFLNNPEMFDAKETKAASKMLFKSVSTILSSPTIDDKTFRDTAQAVFKDLDIYSKLSNTSQLDAFASLTSPEVTAKIVATGDKQLLDRYLGWAMNSVTTLGEFRGVSSDLKAIEAISGFVSAQLDEKGQIKLGLNADDFKDTLPSEAQLGSGRLSYMQKMELRNGLITAQRKVSRFNQVFSSLVPIIEANGLDPQKMLPIILEASNVNLEDRSRNFSQWVFDSLAGGESRGAIKKVNEKSAEDWLNENSTNGIPTPFDLEQVETKPQPVSELTKGTIESRFQEQETLVTGEELIAKKETELEQQMPQEVSKGTVKDRSEIDNVIISASNKYGIDPNAMRVIAKLESSFNPSAKNPGSSAGGLFQFIDSTAKSYKLADRFNPEQASDAAARLARDNSNIFKKRLKREPTAGELYLMHQQGSGGALRLLSNPNKRAVDIVGRDAVRLNGGRLDMTAKEFANLWIQKAERALASL